jgi:ElaB/YqjD/DUF883 family membrane-anchored ribosome-binding protein
MGTEGKQGYDKPDVSAVHDTTARATAYAKQQADDMTKRTQAVARDMDKQIEEYTGRSTEAWLDNGTRMIKQHPWKAVALTAAAVYILGKLRA